MVAVRVAAPWGSDEHGLEICEDPRDLGKGGRIFNALCRGHGRVGEAQKAARFTLRPEPAQGLLRLRLALLGEALPVPGQGTGVGSAAVGDEDGVDGLALSNSGVDKAATSKRFIVRVWGDHQKRAGGSLEGRVATAHWALASLR